MQVAAQTLKYSVGYVGAGKVYYACCYIVDAYTDKDIQAMLQYYPLVVEAAIEFKRFSRKFLSEIKGKVILIAYSNLTLFMICR